MGIERKPTDGDYIKIQDLMLDRLAVCISATRKTKHSAAKLYEALNKKILLSKDRVHLSREFSSSADVAILCHSSKERSRRERFKNTWVIDFDCRDFDKSLSYVSARLEGILRERSRIPEQPRF